ncbi:hypothetical protein [Cellulomonas xiejunii]|uniref:PKD domain-containing protein n=1 Tax=Cellulomonas xiejunii TaxID=2968083 RepID=A0ABY5KTF2_9CELL|nr:hypothetical protein [Cellulomonas xiejunii]MCC2321726.1 hypothetical protein [Cellulomonas xiejunii]UUI73035.1 hypothetical protein NP048_06230 [Cellulomonas xiejunii]
MLAVPLSLGLLAVLGVGNAHVRLDQTSGTAWVVTPSRGLLTLVDGASEQVVVSVRVPALGSEVQVAQAGSSAYVADVDAGTVRRVDGATYRSSGPAPLGSPGQVRVLRGDADAVHVLDPRRRVATEADPVTLAPRHEVSLAATPGAEQAVVDATGRLWVLDPASGELAWFGAGRTGEAGRTAPDARLVLVRGEPVVVDVAGGAVAALGPDGPGRPACLDVRGDDVVEVLGSSTTDEVYAAVEASGTVVTAAVGHDDCRSVVHVGEPGTADFGALAQSGPYLFVPDHAAGTTTVVDTRTRTALDTFALAPPGHRLELVAKDGRVFWNDLDGEDVGVLSLRGGAWVQGESLMKYHPESGDPVAGVMPDDDPGTAPGPGSGPDGAPAPTPRASVGPAPDASGQPGLQAPRGTDGGGAPPPGPGAPGGSGGPSGAGEAPPATAAPPAASASATPTPPLPTITSLVTDRPGYVPGDVVTLTATVVDTPDDATWSWSVVVDGEPLLTGEQGAPGQPFTYAVWPQGSYTFTLTVRGGGGETLRDVTVPVAEDCRPPTLSGPLAFTTAVRTVVVEVEAPGCTLGVVIVTGAPAWLRVPTTVIIPSAPGHQTASMTVELLGEPPTDGLNAGVVRTMLDGAPGPAWDVVAPRGPRVVGVPRCTPGLIAVDLDDAEPAGLTVTATVVIQYRHVFAFPHDPPERTDPPFERVEPLTHTGGGTYTYSHPRSFTQGNDTTYVTATLRSGSAVDRDGLTTTFGSC